MIEQIAIYSMHILKVLEWWVGYGGGEWMVVKLCK